MRYIAPLIGVAIAVPPAFAADHQARIDEVMLSSATGGTDVQFIEIQDPGKTFPGDPYRLEIYDAAGTQVTGSPVNIGMIGSGTMRIFIGTSTAATRFSATNFNNVALPNGILPADGQACFINVGNNKIHCVLWGCVTTPIIGAVNSRAPAPPNDMSSQMQGTGVYLIASPTPNAANLLTGISGPACPTDPPDAGMFADDVFMPPESDVILPDAGSNNNGDGDGCCSVDSRGVAGTLLLTSVVVLMLASSRRRRRP